MTFELGRAIETAKDVIEDCKVNPNSPHKYKRDTTLLLAEAVMFLLADAGRTRMVILELIEEGKLQIEEGEYYRKLKEKMDHEDLQKPS